MPLDTERLHDAFFAESEELIGIAESILMRDLSGAVSQADLAEAHRCVHGLHGAAASLGFDRLARLARCLERRLLAAREDETLFGRTAAERWLDGLALARQTVASLARRQTPSDERIDRMCAVLEASVPTATPASAGSSLLRARMRFAVGRMLVGSELVMEHLLETLNAHGSVVAVQEPDPAGERVWVITAHTSLSRAALSELFDHLAEPGSLQIEFDHHDFEHEGGAAGGPPEPAERVQGDAPANVPANASATDGGKVCAPGNTDAAASKVRPSGAELPVPVLEMGVGDQWLGLPAESVVEVHSLRHTDVLTIPASSTHLARGVRLGDRLVPLVALSRVFSDQVDIAADEGGESRVMVIVGSQGEAGVALACERVRSDSVAADRVVTVPTGVAGWQLLRFAFASGARTGLVLDPEALSAWLLAPDDCLAELRSERIAPAALCEAVARGKHRIEQWLTKASDSLAQIDEALRSVDSMLGDSDPTELEALTDAARECLAGLRTDADVLAANLALAAARGTETSGQRPASRAFAQACADLEILLQRMADVHAADARRSTEYQACLSRLSRGVEVLSAGVAGMAEAIADGQSLSARNSSDPALVQIDLIALARLGSMRQDAFERDDLPVREPRMSATMKAQARGGRRRPGPLSKVGGSRSGRALDDEWGSL